ncbi:ATP-binding protein [Cocleimonas sp. KMM 6892]|uniref:ATP-binding protein n=1 Tax=unclassified Cocleimonas TaxID=2639732 RepID=UPI002DB6181C|nr:MULTISPECIES: ATP-binding protein [unclassified Cocleimonas]MEB8433951.1 ATP-binding protein [Cocleimonas sp. KMM 6892]MEC4716762.1 ATP-binding protein [Cocleimonas sp. KMM 6895]MEC4746083.1 ATP-binding protein [Cocleimonas sp. KMM 6896]
MIKLFITLYIMVLASFGLFIGSGVMLDYLGDKLIASSNIERDITQGTFNLLDQSIHGLNEGQTRDLIKEYQREFGDEFGITDISQITLDKKQTVKLQKGEIVILDHSTHSDDSSDLVEMGTDEDIKNKNENEDEDAHNILYRKIPESNKAWRINLDIDSAVAINDQGVSTTIKGGQYAEGMLYLIQKELSQVPLKQWPDVIKEIQMHFGLTLKLTNLDDIKKSLSNPAEQLVNLLEGKVINSTQGSNYTTFVQKIKSDILSKYPDNGSSANENLAIQVGPIEIPWFIRNLPTLIILAFVLSIATALFLWLLPLWSNLQKIKKAAIEFGNGNYDTRIPTRKRSSIADVTTAFNSMAERTQDSIRSQKELTSAVSHELRTPVARMRFALEMLENTDDQKAKLRYSSDINDDIDELDQLLEELLSYARFDQSTTRLNVRMEKLSHWLTESMNKLMPLANDKKLNYQIIGIGANESASFEPRLLSRVLDNLVQNAIRYAKHNIEVTLCKDNDHYLLIVEDDGCGIQKQQRTKVFEAFSRLDASRDKATGGFGLGLAISDKIIKAHNGEIKIRESALGGARFEVYWPLKIQ